MFLFLSALPLRAQAPSSADALEGSLAALRAAGDRRGEARTLKELGNLRFSQGDADQAAALARQALPIAQELKDRDLEARLQNNLGLALQALGHETEAYESFLASRRIAVADKNETVEAIALGNLADVELARGDLEMASQKLKRATSLIPRLGNPAVSARVLASLAKVRAALEDWDGALAAYQQALPYGQETGLSLGVAGLWLGIGQTLGAMDRSAEAIEAYQKSFEIGRQIPDDDTQAAALQGMAIVYNTLKDSGNEAAVAERLQQIGARLSRADLLEPAELHRKAAAFREENRRAREATQKEVKAALDKGDRKGAALSYLELGTRCLAEEEPEKAADAWFQSLQLARETGETLIVKAALPFLSDLFSKLRFHPRETEYLRGMADAVHDLGDRQVEALLRLQLGMAWLNRREPDQALEPLAQALSLLAGQGLPEQEREALENLAFAHRLRGDRDETIRTAERLLREAGDDPRWAGAAFHQIGMAHLEKEDLEPAARALEASAAAYEKAPGQEPDLLTILFTLGAVKLNLGAESQANDCFRRITRLAAGQKDRDSESLAWGALADLALVQGDFDNAQEAAERSQLLASGSRKAYVRNSAATVNGSLALALGDDRQALAAWERILAIARETKALPGDPDPRSMEVLAQGVLARAHANLKEFTVADELATNAVALADSMGSSEERSLALDHLAYVQFLEGCLEEAETSLRQAIELFESKRSRLSEDLHRASALDQVSTAYDLLQQVLVRRGKPEEALAVAERGRARAFLESLRGTDGPLPTLARLREEAAAVGAPVIEYSLLHDPAKTLAPGRIQGKQAGFEQDLFLWVVPPSGPVVFRSVNLKERLLENPETDSLAQQILRLGSYAAGKRSGARLDRQELLREIRDLRDLYDVLIAPIAAQLPPDPDAPVVIIPHGPLFLAPFPALMDPAGRYLVEQHTILVAPSIETLAAFRRPERSLGNTSGEDNLIVGDPVLSPLLRDRQLARLPSAAAEACQIADALGTEPLIGEQATRAAVVERMSRARLIHLATHGLSTAGSSEEPGALVLAPAAPEEDGLLLAETVRHLHLEASLVVLSACDSGQGRLSGDGVIGLARSFLAAGAAGAVTTLWRIDDEGTPALMVDFYRHLSAGKDPARSLRAAMQTALEHGVAPLQWGAFLFIGAPPPGAPTSPSQTSPKPDTTPCRWTRSRTASRSRN
jgi:CHAT domain-containing protein